MAANMMPLMMMCSMSVSSSSSSGLVLAPLFFFWRMISGFFKTLMNPLGAAKGLIKAPFNIAKRGVRGVGRLGKKGFRGVKRLFRKRRAGFRRFKRAFRRPRFRRFRRVFRRPRIRIRRPRFRCFSPETPIQLENGKTVKIKNLKLGDTLINGSIVEAVMRIKNYDDPYYKIGDIYVTGKHYVRHGMKYVQVKDLPNAKLTDKVDDVVSCLVTSDHKIPVGNMVFWDWEDNLIPTKKNVDVIFNKIRSARAARKTVAQ